VNSEKSAVIPRRVRGIQGKKIATTAESRLAMAFLPPPYPSSIRRTYASRGGE